MSSPAGEWWRGALPALGAVAPGEFNDPRWQLRSAASSQGALEHWLKGAVSQEFFRQLRAGLRASARPLRVTPQLLALVDWSDPWADPVRRQYLPLGPELEPDHPLCRPDPLAEGLSAPVSGLVRRYPDRALLLAVPSCPAYCRFCTRSYAVGPSAKGAGERGWDQALRTVEADPSIRDLTISGGDCWMLGAGELASLGERLLRIPQLERLRFATRGLASLPQRVEGDPPWRAALLAIARRGTQRGLRVALHAHFNHAAELSPPTLRALARLQEGGLALRSQTVLLRGVNDSADALLALQRALVRAGVQPYYVYTADMAPGSEHLRCTLGCAVELEKQLRGQTAGFDMPGFVCDVLGGGGKRGVHSYEVYDPSIGLALYRSPVVDPGRLYLHCDPLRTLEPSLRRRWLEPDQREALIEGLRRTLVHAPGSS